MKRVLRWAGMVVGVLLLLVIIAAGIGYARGTSMLTTSENVEIETFEIPTDAESIANGEYLANSLLACYGCHGEDFGGTEFINDPGFLVVNSANLTRGEGGVAGTYTDEDWARALRHGIRPNGENLFVMPAQFLGRVSAEDLGDIVAYLKTLPPVDRVTPEREIGFMPRILIGLGMMPPEVVHEIIPATGIDHSWTPPSMPAQGVTEEWGEYRVLVCRACHGEALSGRPADPQSGSAASPNLTPGGELLVWTEADFLAFMRSGITPTGREVDPTQMPWEEFANATDDDLKAIFLYLQSLEALETNN